MAITPISNAVIQRTDDVGMFKRNEDAKPFVDQQNIQVKVDQREDILNHQVLDPGESGKTENDTDPRKEGRGKYTAKRNSQKKEKSQEKADRVVRKQTGGSFDIKI